MKCMMNYTLIMLVGNNLLASMGKLGRDNLLLLSEGDTEEYEFFIDVER